MKLPSSIAVAFFALSYFAAPVAAQQSGPYVRLSVSSMHMGPPGGHFRTGLTAQPSVALGYGWRQGHSVEVRASYLKTETTEEIPKGVLVDAPYTIGVRAVPLGITYQYRLPSLANRVYPLVSSGLMWARVVDTWQSDTPAESQSASVYGLEAATGLAVQLIDGAFIVARGGYRAIRSTGDRYFRAIGLGGPFADIGLQWQW